MASEKDQDKGLQPKVPTERPNREAASRDPEGGQDRPGFDLGGASEDEPSGPKNTIPGGPRSSPAGRAATGAASGAGSGEGSGPTSGAGRPKT